MTRSRGARQAALVIAVAISVAGVGPSVQAGSSQLHVVEPGESIQAAIDGAGPGDTVRVLAGTYHENVTVDVPDLTLTGVGPDETVLEGGAEDDDGVVYDGGIGGHGIHVTADGVTVRNLTVRGFGGHGVFFTGVTGFYVEQVHALRNGPYGIYAFESRIGHLRDSVARGHRDSGVYIGEVDSCQCVLEDLVVEDNLIGYSGTGASHVTIRESTFRHNAAGIVPNVLVGEHHRRLQTYLYAHDNQVVDNNNATASDKWHFEEVAHVPEGLGIVVAGGSWNLITDNVVEGHVRAGVAVAWLFSEPSFNEIRGNVLDNPATPDHPRALDILWDGGGANNCFEGNAHPGGEVTYDAGTLWNTAGSLPDCDTPSAAPPDPGQLAREISLIFSGCEIEAQPGDPCHLEGVPVPH